MAGVCHHRGIAVTRGTVVAFIHSEHPDGSDLGTPGGDRMGIVVIVLLVLLLIGALPTWPYSSGWGYFPSGGLGLVLLIVLILALTGRI
jgi:hypothetical protein